MSTPENDPVPGGSGGGGGEVTQGAGDGTETGFWTVRISNGAAFIPLPIALGAGGGVKVDGSGTALPVSGPLTDTELRATAVPVSGTFFQATQPVSAASLPLPSGAATEAKQPAIGTAGTSSADVISVQGVAGGTAIPVSGTVTASVSGVATEVTLAALNAKVLATAAASDALANPTTGGLLSYSLGWNGTSWTRIKTTSSGGTLAVGNNGFTALQIAGKTSGSVWTDWRVDTSGRAVMVGAASNGATIAGDPVLIGGSDGTNARTVTLKNSNPIAADYGVEVRPIPTQKTSVKTTAGTPATSLVVRAGPCWLYDVFLSNQTATACYLTAYDLTSAPTNGAAATARKITGRHIDTKAGADPFNFKEDHSGLYFATGCVLVLEMAEDDANTNTTGAPTVAMCATFVAGT